MIDGRPQGWQHLWGRLSCEATRGRALPAIESQLEALSQGLEVSEKYDILDMKGFANLARRMSERGEK